MVRIANIFVCRTIWQEREGTRWPEGIGLSSASWVALIVLALAVPWWTIIRSETLPVVGEIHRAAWDCGLFNGKYALRSTKYVSTPSIEVAFLCGKSMRTIMVFAAVALAVAVGAYDLVGGFRKPRRNSLRSLSPLPSLVSSTLTLFAATYVMALLPVAVERDLGTASRLPGFWGSVSWTSSGVANLFTWGPSVGWLLALAAGITFLVNGLVLTLVGPRRAWLTG